MRIVLLLMLLTGVLVGCATSGVADLNGDMNSFLSQNGLATTHLKCSLLGNGVVQGPDGMCLLTMSEAEVPAMVSALGLEQKLDSVVTWMPSGPDCWTRLDFHDQNIAQWYLSPANDSHLQLANGKRLAYFRLFYLRDNRAACISVSYANN